MRALGYLASAASSTSMNSFWRIAAKSTATRGRIGLGLRAPTTTNNNNRNYDFAPRRLGRGGAWTLSKPVGFPRSGALPTTSNWLGHAIVAGAVVGAIWYIEQRGGVDSREPLTTHWPLQVERRMTIKIRVEGIDLETVQLPGLLDPITGLTTGWTLHYTPEMLPKLVELAEIFARAGRAHDAHRWCILAYDALLHGRNGEMAMGVHKQMDRIALVRRVAKVLEQLDAVCVPTRVQLDVALFVEAVGDVSRIVYDSQCGYREKAPDPAEIVEVNFSRIQARFPENVTRDDLAKTFVRLGDLYAYSWLSEEAVACYVFAVNIQLLDDSSLPDIEAYDADLPRLDFWRRIDKDFYIWASLPLSQQFLDKLGVEYQRGDDRELDRHFDDLDSDDVEALHDTPRGFDLRRRPRYELDQVEWDRLMVALIWDGTLREMAVDRGKAREYTEEVKILRAGEQGVALEQYPVEDIDWEYEE